MKWIKTFRESLNYIGDDDLTDDEVLFHGTSLKQWYNIIKSNYNVEDFYVGDDENNIANNYAELQSLKDDSDAVIIILNSEYLDGELKDDYHENRQIGQYIFNGNIKKAIHTVKNASTNGIITTYKEI